MKKLVLVSLIPLLAFQCAKKDKCMEGRIVRITCASIVIQVLNNDKIGEDNWTDGMNSNRSYDNVFSVSNTCQLNSPKVGDTLRFKIREPIPTDCVNCMMYDAPPREKFHVEKVPSCD